MSTKESIIHKLNEAKADKASLMKSLEENKNNPYWYEDYGVSIKLADARIERLEEQLKEFA